NWLSVLDTYRHRNRPHTFAQHDVRRAFGQWYHSCRSEQKRSADRWMPRERQLPAWCEDANAPRVRWIFGWQYEHGLREIELLADLLHLLRIQPACIGQHRERIAAEYRVGED